MRKQARKLEDIVWFPLTIYPYYIGITNTKKGLLKGLKRLGITTMDGNLDGSSGQAIHLEANNKNQLSVIYLTDRNEPIDKYTGYIVHECVHCWQQLKDYIQEHNPGRECEAYMLEWLVIQSLTILYED